MKRLLSAVLAVVMLCAMLPQIPLEVNAHSVVMSADEFIGYLQYVVDRGDSRYGSGDKLSVGKYDGNYIYFDCWGLGESIICTKGQIVYNRDTSLNPWNLWDTSCGCGSYSGDWLKTQCQLSSDFSNIVPGEWLFRDNSSGNCYHVGYYIGNGKVIESTSDGSYNTQVSTIDSSGHSNLRGSSWSWTSHGKVPWIEYCNHSYNNVGFCSKCQTEYNWEATYDTSCAGIYKVSLSGGVYLRTDKPYAASTAKSALIKEGTQVEVLGSVTNAFDHVWHKVSYNGTIGYSSEDNLSFVSHTCDKGTYLYFEAEHPHRDCYECSVCGKVWAVDGTSNYYSSCSECKCSHSYTSTVTKAATCATSGVRTYTCSKCGDSYTETIAATGNHSYSSSVTKAATCGSTGVRTYTCRTCSKSYTETIPATGNHSYSSSVTKAATCGSTGVRTYTCRTCSRSYTETIPATGNHSYGAWVRFEDGTERRDCNDCDDYESRIPVTSNIVDSGICGDELTWDLDSEGTLFISGTGAMYDYNNGPGGSGSPWKSLAVKRAVIMYGVTSVGTAAFDGCSELISVTISNTVTKIGSSAFSGANKLSMVTIPDSVTSIGEWAFCATDLITVNIPDGISRIEAWTFANCTELKCVTIGKNVQSIGIRAFSNCTLLSDIYYAGAEERWNSISIYDYNDGLDNVIMHYNCEDYEPDVPVTPNVYVITIDERNGNEPSVTQIAPGSTYTLPTIIPEYLDFNFEGWECDGTTYQPGQTITPTGDMTFTPLWIGWEIYDVDEYQEYGYSMNYPGVGAYFWLIIDEPGDYQFKGLSDSSLDTKIWIYDRYGNLITSDDDGAGNYQFLLETYLEAGGYSVKIGTYRSDVTGTLRWSIAPISGTAGNITWCVRGRTLTLSGTGDMPDYSSSSETPWGSFAGEIETVVIESGITSVGNNAFCNYTELVNIDISDDVRRIGDSAFAFCDSLREIILPDNLKELGEAAFDFCEKLQYVTIPQGITEIKIFTFDNCLQLSSLVIPEGVETIGAFAFQCCESMRSITIPKSVRTIDQGAFYDCSQLENVYYQGSLDQWNEINIASYNESITEAHLHIIQVKQGWVQENSKWYFYENGAMVKNAWRKDFEDWCYLGADGTKQKQAWIDDIYYVDADGYRVTGIYEINGTQYHFNDDGTLKPQYTVVFRNWDGTQLSAQRYWEGQTPAAPGAPTRASDNTFTYAFAGWDQPVVAVNGNATYTAKFTAVPKETVKNGWVKENGIWYYYENGTMVKNAWRKDSVGWCYLGADGAMLVNTWKRDSVGWCYIGNSGYIVYNKWVRDSVGWCYVGANGYMVTNKWVRDSVGWCYIGANGYAVTNCWKQDSTGKWCHLNANGSMDYNKWVRDSKGWCYVGKDGYMVTNAWAKDSIGWYWMGSDGYAIKNTSKTIGGKTYHFNASGLCTNP